MSRVCELTGKKAMTGNNVSFSMNKTKRRFNVNLFKKKFYLPEEDKWVNKKGITQVVKEARAKGYLTK